MHSITTQGLAVYCGEGGGERAAAPLLQVLSEFASSLESAVKKYDARVEAEKRRAAKLAKGKEKENRVNSSPNRLLKASALQPHVGLADTIKKIDTGTTKPKQEVDPRQAMFEAIKNRNKGDGGGAAVVSGGLQSRDKSRRRKSTSSKSEQGGVADRQALFAAIKDGKKPSELSASTSRVLLVNRMLSEAPANVKQGEL